MALTAPGRYEATVLGVHAGQRLIKAQLYDESQTPRRLAAEAVGQVSVPYPQELAPDQLGADPSWLASLSPETGTHAGPLDEVLTTPGAPHGTRTRPVWPRSCGRWCCRCCSSTCCCAASPSATRRAHRLG